MKRKLFSALFVLVLIPSVVYAEKPGITSLKHQVVMLTEIIKEIQADLAKTHAELLSTQAELAMIKNNTVLGLDGLLTLTQDTDGNDTILFDGVNVQVVNGAGSTNSVNGLGNVVIGYNMSSSVSANRQGSHNIVLGDEQSYPDTQEVVTEKIISNHDLSLTVANNLSTLVGANQLTSIGADRTVSVGRDNIENIAAAESISVGADRAISIGANKIEDIGDSVSVAVSNSASMSVGTDMDVSIGRDVLFEAGDEILIKTGKASGLFKKNGDITIDGKDITIKASGDLHLKGSRILQN